MIIDVDELAAMLGRTFTDAERQQAETTISNVQGEIEGYLRRPIEIRTVADEQIPLKPEQRVIFPSITPVLSVNAFTINDTVIPVSDFMVNRYGVQLYTLNYFGGLTAPPVAKLSYTGGLDGKNISEIMTLIRRGSARELNRLKDDVYGVRAFGAEGSRVEYEDILLEGELKKIAHHKRRRLG